MVGAQDLAAPIKRTLEAHGVTSWTTVVPAIVSAQTVHYAWSESEPENMDLLAAQAAASAHVPVLLIGVHRDTCDWERGLAVANACRAVVAEHIAVDLHIYVAEMVISPLADGERPNADRSDADNSDADRSDSDRSDADRSDAAHTPPHLLDVVEPRYGETKHDTGTYKHNDLKGMQEIPGLLSKYLPFPGQKIQQAVTMGGKQGLSGTLTCYVRLNAKDGTQHDGLYGLASRHVAIGKRYDHGKKYIHMSPPPLSSDDTDTAQPPPMIMSWGNSVQIATDANAIKKAAEKLAPKVTAVCKRVGSGKGTLEDEEQLALGEHILKDYAQNIVAALESATSTGTDSSTDYGDNAAVSKRKIGHVAFSGAHRRNGQNGWSDWALIAIDPIQHSPNNERSTVRLPAYQTNHVYMGQHQELFIDNWNAQNGLHGATANELTTDSAGFIRLSPPLSLIDDGKNDDEDDGKDEPMPDVGEAKADKTARSDDNDNDDDDYLPPRYVYHHGAVSGLSIGTLSPVEAFSRLVLDGREEIVWSLPVFGGHDAERPSETPFSDRGDSGACVFDVFGRIVSMLDGGLTADKNKRLFLAHPGVGRSRT